LVKANALVTASLLGEKEVLYISKFILLQLESLIHFCFVFQGRKCKVTVSDAPVVQIGSDRRPISLYREESHLFPIHHQTPQKAAIWFLQTDAGNPRNERRWRLTSIHPTDKW